MRLWLVCCLPFVDSVRRFLPIWDFFFPFIIRHEEVHFISRRNRLFKKHAKNPTDSSWEEYRKQRNKVTALKRKGMKSFCIDASLNTKHHGEFWRKMKPLLMSKTKLQSKIVLLENEQLITDPKCVAETFNDYFSEVAVSEGDHLSVDEF